MLRLAESVPASSPSSVDGYLGGGGRDRSIWWTDEQSNARTPAAAAASPIGRY